MPLCNCLLLANSGYLQRRALPTLRWLKSGLPYLLRVALPAGAAQIVWQSGYLTLFVLVASLPTDSVNALAGLKVGQFLGGFYSRTDAIDDLYDQHIIKQYGKEAAQ